MVKKLLIPLSCIFLFAACKKNDGDDNASKVLGKWTFVKDYLRTYENGQLVSTDTVYFSPANYAEFKSDGKVYSHSLDTSFQTTTESYDTLEYKVEGNTVLTLTNGEWKKADIITLTANEFDVHAKDSEQDNGINRVYETWSYLTK